MYCRICFVWVSILFLLLQLDFFQVYQLDFFQVWWGAEAPHVD